MVAPAYRIRLDSGLEVEGSDEDHIEERVMEKWGV